MVRCAWAGVDPLYVDYHDTEWGRPVRGDTALFERLSLEAFQSGLSWIVVLRKRPAFREAFAGFDPQVVAAMGEPDIARLMADAGIVRNRAKITAVIGNARALLAWQEREGDGVLDAAVWAGHAPASPRPVDPSHVRAVSQESTNLARLLKARGFSFVGPTTMHAALQACGVIDEHLQGCSVATGPSGVV